jgi:hypothetical protein
MCLSCGSIYRDLKISPCLAMDPVSLYFDCSMLTGSI